MIPKPEPTYTRWTGLKLQRPYVNETVKTANRFQYVVTCNIAVQANLIIDAANESDAKFHIREALSQSKLFVPDLDGWFVGGAVGLTTPTEIVFEPAPHGPIHVLPKPRPEEKATTPPGTPARKPRKRGKKEKLLAYRPERQSNKPKTRRPPAACYEVRFGLLFTRGTYHQPEPQRSRQVLLFADTTANPEDKPKKRLCARSSNLTKGSQDRETR
jgi:hypothetical protein